MRCMRGKRKRDAVEEKIREMQWRKKWGNLCGDSAVRHLMQCAVRQMQVAPSLLPVQVCIRLPVLDADCASMGVSSWDDGGDDAHSIILIICTNGKTEMTDAG